MEPIEQIRLLNFIVEKAQKIVTEPNLSWEEKYNLIFEVIHPAVESLQIKFDWYDPDEGYQDDVLAYVDSLERKLETFNKIFND